MKLPHPGVYSYYVHIYHRQGFASRKCWDTDGIEASVAVWSGALGGLLKKFDKQPVENPEPTCLGQEKPASTCHAYWHVFNLDATTDTYEWVNKFVPEIPTAGSSTGSSSSFLPRLPSCTCSLAPAVTEVQPQGGTTERVIGVASTAFWSAIPQATKEITVEAGTKLIFKWQSSNDLILVTKDAWDSCGLVRGNYDCLAADPSMIETCDSGVELSKGADNLYKYEYEAKEGVYYFTSSKAGFCGAGRKVMVTVADKARSTWGSFTQTAARNLYGDFAGLGSKSCDDELQAAYTASNGADYATKSITGADAVDALAATVGKRFSDRYAQVTQLANRAVEAYAGIYAVQLKSPRRAAMCNDPCYACNFNAGFGMRINPGQYGYRYGAHADYRSGSHAGTCVSGACVDDEKAMEAVGDLIVNPLATQNGTFAQDSTTKWAFVGTEMGAFAIAPQWEGAKANCRDYDPRLRPWYAEAIAGRKNVVIVIDGSSASNGNSAGEGMVSLKQAARAVLGTLAAGDTANVVVARNSGTTPEVMGDTGASGEDETYDECQNDRLLQTVTINKDLLLRFVTEVGPQGGHSKQGAVLDTAITKAQELLAAQQAYSDTGAKEIIVVLTASEGSSSTAATALRGARAGAKWAFYGLRSSTWNIADSSLALAADAKTDLAVTDAGYEPARYYMVLKNEPMLTMPFVSAFYEDTAGSSGGLGLVTTVVAPVVVDGSLKGVVGVDVTVQDLVSDLLFDVDFLSSYSFIVDSAGQVVWHPALPSPQDAKGVEPVTITDLEVSDGFKNNVLAGLLDGSTGSQEVTMDMVQARGDATYAGFGRIERTVTYAYRPIDNTPFRLCVVLTKEDQSGKTLKSPPDTASCEEGTYDCIGKGGLQDCQVYHDLPLGHTCNVGVVNTGVDYIPNRAGVFYASSAFQNPVAWLEHQETPIDAEQIAQAHTCSNCGLPYVSKTVGRLDAAAVNDNMLAAKALDVCWNNRVDDKVVWQYFGSTNGLYRSAPAHAIGKSYDPTKRPWYLASIANKKTPVGESNPVYGITISTPYLDMHGQGEVVTVSRAITRGGNADTDPVAGVVAMDIKLSQLQSILNRLGDEIPGAISCGESSTTCLLIDDTGHVIYHPDFVSTNAAEENVFISDKHRELADALVKGGWMTQSTCMDYANGLRKTSYKVEIATDAGGELSCGSWDMAVVGAREGQANLLLIVLSSNGCIDGTKARNTQCVPCTEENCKSGNHVIPSSTSLVCQPCRCHRKYNSCSLSYKKPGQDGVDACPASPPPQTTAVCPSLPDDKLRSALEASHPGYCWKELSQGDRLSKTEWPDNTDLIFTANLGRTIITLPKSLLASVNGKGVVTDWRAPADGIAMIACPNNLDAIMALEATEIAGIVVCLLLISILLCHFCRKKSAPKSQGVKLQSRPAQQQTPYAYGQQQPGYPQQPPAYPPQHQQPTSPPQQQQPACTLPNITRVCDLGMCAWLWRQRCHRVADVRRGGGWPLQLVFIDRYRTGLNFGCFCLQNN
jgi:hypothetical protein